MKTIKNSNIRSITKQLSITMVFNFATTILLLMMSGVGFTDVNIVVVYILSVLVTSSYTKGYIYGIVASVISMLSFNFFFTEPIFTFKVDDSAYIITFIVMLLSSIFTSTLASKLIRSKELANEREKQSHILYSITSSLAKTSDLPEVAAVSAGCLSSLFHCKVLCAIINTKDSATQMFQAEKDAGEVLEINMETATLEDTIVLYSSFPIKVRENLVSYVCMPKELENMNHEYRFLLDSVIIQVTNAMERVLLIRDKEAAKSEMERERFKSNLLRAISHDIRTPLTRITGAAQMLQHSLKEDANLKLVHGIYEDSSWLTRLVENILSLTRIQEGKLTIHIQLEAVEEILASAINQASKYSPHHKISTTIPDEVLFIPMDGKLIEQVLINLINNAIEHTTPSNDILVTVKPEKDKVWFEVNDNGAGINELDLTNVFDMFYVSKNSRTDGKQGMGLGLAICKAIVNFHGGDIFAKNNATGGSTFYFYLNL